MRQKLFYLSLILISTISLVGALVYRIYSFNTLGVIISLLLSAFLFWILFNFLKKNNYSAFDIEQKYVKDKLSIKRKDVVLIILYSVLFLLAFLILYKARTMDSLISPWQSVSKWFFVVYFFSTLALVLIIIRGIKRSIIFVMLHSFLSLSVLFMVFKLGYGYDPFIHQATIELVKEKGQVLPKPLYYLGQYSLVFLFHKMIFIKIAWLDKLLVPVLSAIFIPGTIYIFLKEKFEDKKIILLSVVLFFILPFSFFTITTPQYLAFLFLILTIFLALLTERKKEFIVPMLLSLACFFMHPLAGIPAILFVCFLLAYNFPFYKIKRIIYATIFLVLILALPILFYITERAITPNRSTPEMPEVEAKASALIPEIQIPSEDNFVLNFIYAFEFQKWIIIFILITLAAIYAWRKRTTNRKMAICFVFFVCLFISYLLTRELDFNFLINYERENYSQRILFASIMFLLPIFAILFYKIIEKINKQNNFIKISLLIFGLIVITTSLYLNYPRKDSFNDSRSFSVGKNDLEAVRFIERDAFGEDYIVLANQQVSVAALWEFGFNKYFKEDIYFYPIPTGGPLYRYYLSMVDNHPSRGTIEGALNLTGAKKGYFVLNKYWWAFDKISEEAKMEAESWHELNNGEIIIFKY